MTDELLTLILDRLLPGDDDGDWPAAGALGLAPRMRALMEGTEAGRAALPEVAARLAPDFANLEGPAQDAALAALEAEAPDLFDPLITAAYNAYYTDPRVRDLIERLTGYPNRPPQPLGYDLPPFDEGLLDKVRARDPFWRKADD